MLYNQYATKYLLLCSRYAKNKLDAEEILQEGFLKIYTKIGSYKAEGSFEGWMRTVMVNTALEFLRKQKIEFATLTDEHENCVQENTIGIHDLEVKDILLLIHELPIGCKIVFNLFVFEQFGHDEIAAKLQITKGTSKSQLNRARNLLQEKILSNNAYLKLLKADGRK